MLAMGCLNKRNEKVIKNKYICLHFKRIYIGPKLHGCEIQKRVTMDVVFSLLESHIELVIVSNRILISTHFGN